MAKPNALSAAIGAIRSEITARQTEIEELEAQRQAIASAPAHPSDLHAAIDQWVDQQAARYRRPLHELLAGMIAAPLLTDSLMSDSARPWFGKPLSLATGTNERPVDGAVSAAALALVAGELVRTALKAEVDAMTQARPAGLALVERRAKLAELELAIAGKRSGLEELRAEAAASGMSLAI